MRKTVISTNFNYKYSFITKIKLFLFNKKRHYYSNRYNCYIKKVKITGNLIDGVVYGEPYDVAWEVGSNV